MGVLTFDDGSSPCSVGLERIASKRSDLTVEGAMIETNLVWQGKDLFDSRNFNALLIVCCEVTS